MVSKEKYNSSRNYCMRTLLKFMKLLGKKRKYISLWNFVQMAIFLIELSKMDPCLKNKLLEYFIKFYRDFFISKKWEYHIGTSNLKISSLIVIGLLKLLILDSAVPSIQLKTKWEPLFVVLHHILHHKYYWKQHIHLN